jgi:hypothetical protein
VQPSAQIGSARQRLIQVFGGTNLDAHSGQFGHYLAQFRHHLLGGPLAVEGFFSIRPRRPNALAGQALLGEGTGDTHVSAATQQLPMFLHNADCRGVVLLSLDLLNHRLGLFP